MDGRQATTESVGRALIVVNADLKVFKGHATSA
jgi:hypothetical protein